jgi:4-hydroxy-3-methylbut-2-enyl diphosphate reductase
VQQIVGFFGNRNDELRVIEEGEWEDITFRPPKRVPPRPSAS